MAITRNASKANAARERKRLTLDLDPDLHLRIKVAAAKAHLSMREYLEEILRQTVPAVAATPMTDHRPISSEAVSLLRQTREEVSHGRVFPDSTDIVRRMRDEQANGSQP